MTPMQLKFDFEPVVLTLKDYGLQGHYGPIWDDPNGEGCDCCAQRLRCAKCGQRYLGRLYAYYNRYDTRDEDGYCIGRNGSYGDLPGPCCLPENAGLFDQLVGNYDDYPVRLDSNAMVRKGQFVLGAWGVLTSRIWIPKEWPVGKNPWEKDYEERQAKHAKRRRADATRRS